MSNTPSTLRYIASHEWVRQEADGTVTIGITDHAQNALGDLVYVELPAVGRVVAQDESVAVVESVKAASDVYSPLSGEILSINEALVDSPELINQEPYQAGWLWAMRLSNASELDGLLDAAGYEATL